MNSRKRFRESLHYGFPRRLPYFEEEIRQEVIDLWRRQGLPADAQPADMFPTDRLVELELDLEPNPRPANWPISRLELRDFRRLLNPEDPSRFPSDWPAHSSHRPSRDSVLIYYVHEGFFISMGVDGWRRFAQVMDLVHDDPQFVCEMMAIQGEFAASMADKVLREVEIDAAAFSEPIGGNHGPLISPRMYEEIVLPSYQPLLDVLRRHGVETIIYKTYANARILVPCILKRGINCLWACEVNAESMDYRNLRMQFGRNLRLIGGIDLDSLRRGREAIREEILEKVPPLLADGGYIPLADGRIREDVTFENYVYYRRLLNEVTGANAAIGGWS